MKNRFYLKFFFASLILLTFFSCSNYLGLSLAERQELKVKDTPALTVERLPTIMNCEKVDAHYELEVLAISEKNLRFPKADDNYTINFDAFVTNEVMITALKATFMNQVFFIPLKTPIASKSGRISVSEEFKFPKEIPNLRVALKNVKVYAIVECAATEGVTFTLTKTPQNHISSDNVEIEYVAFEAPVTTNEVTITFKNYDDSVFKVIKGRTGEPFVVPTEIPERPGRTFVKWIGIPETFPETNAEYEASWKLTEYFIDYVLNGGVNSAANPDCYYDYSDITFYPASKNGCIFDGWYTDSNFENKIETIQYGRRENLTLYAKFIEIKVGQITMNPTSQIIVGGKIANVQAILKMQDGSTPTVKFTSSDPSVLTIDDDGTVRTNRIEVPSDSYYNGTSYLNQIIKTVTITASYENLKATCEVTVLPPKFTKYIFEKVWPNYAEIIDFVIPDGIEVLYSPHLYGVFEGKRNIKSVTIPDSVEQIDSYTFYGCTNLVSVNLPENLTYIGTSAFYYCSSLTGPLELPENLTYIGSYAFDCCSSLTGTVTIPEGVTKIDSYTFYGCKNLVSVNLPENLTYIGSSAFDCCFSLTGPLELPENLTYIGSYAFDCCSSLTGTVTIPEGVTKIDSFTFYGCKNLVSVNLPENLTYIGSAAFDSCFSLTGPLELPENLTYIGSYAFYSCFSLTGTVTIPEGVTKIEDYTFCDCSSVTKFEIPDSVRIINKYAFYNCSSGFDGVFTIPKDCEYIYDSAFYGCNIKEVKIPATTKLKKAGGYASSSHPRSDNAFSETTTKVTITGTLTEYNPEFWNRDILVGFSYLEEIAFENVPPGYKVVDGVLYNDTLTKLVYGPKNKGGKEENGHKYFVIPENITEIGDYALYGYKWGFWNYSNKVTRVGDYAFAYGISVRPEWPSLNYIGINAYLGGGSKKETLPFHSTTGWYWAPSPSGPYTAIASSELEDASLNYTEFTSETGKWKDKYLIKR